MLPRFTYTRRPALDLAEEIVSEIATPQTLRNAKIPEVSPLGENAEVELRRFPSVEEAQQHPIQALMSCRTLTEAWNRKHGERLNDAAAAAYAAHHKIERNFVLWKEFIGVANALSAFKRPVRVENDRQKSWLLVVRFVFGWTHDYDRAYKIARGLELYKLEGRPPEDIPALIKRTGFEDLYKVACRELPFAGRNAREKARMKQAYAHGWRASLLDDLDPGNSVSTTASYLNDLDSGDGLNSGADLRTGQSPSLGAVCQTAASNSVTRHRPYQTLEVEVEPEQLQSILSAPRGQRYLIEIELIEALPDGWKRFQAVGVS